MRPEPDLSAYLVLDTAMCGGADPVDVALAAAQGGIRCFQLRAKDAATPHRIALGKAIKTALSPFPYCLIINDDVAAAVEIGADGAHVGQSDMPPAQARALLGPDRILGLSVETVAQAPLVDPALVDHVGIGPVRATATKRDAAAPLGFDGLAQAVAACPVPAVAIGGIKGADAAAVFRSGAAGLAVVTAICGQPDPRAAAVSLVASITEAQQI